MKGETHKLMLCQVMGMLCSIKSDLADTEPYALIYSAAAIGFFLLALCFTVFAAGGWLLKVARRFAAKRRERKAFAAIYLASDSEVKP